MSLQIILKETTHDFTKVNQITKYDRAGPYDLMKCARCNLRGKRRQLDRIDVDGRSSAKASLDCPNVKSDVPKKVRITNFTGYSSNFANITTGSVHNVIAAPDSYREKYPNSRSTVWIEGVREPTRLLSGEFEIIE